MAGFLDSLNDGEAVPVVVVTVSSLIVLILLLLTCFKIRQRIKARAQTIDQDPFDFPVPAPDENDEKNVEKLFQPPPPKTDVASAHEMVTADVHKCKSSSCAKCTRRKGEYVAGDTTFVDVTSSSRSFWTRQLQSVMPRNPKSQPKKRGRSSTARASSSSRLADEVPEDTAIEVSMNEIAQESSPV